MPECTAVGDNTVANPVEKLIMQVIELRSNFAAAYR